MKNESPLSGAFLFSIEKIAAFNLTIGEGKEAKRVNVIAAMINGKENIFTILEQTKSGE